MEEGWECVEGCPVLELGRQSGVKKSGERKPVLHATERAVYGQHKASGLNHFQGSEGTAARFFMQFGEDNLIEPVQEVTSVQVINDDCLEAMRQMPDACIDSIVTDPPAGINFMNKAFDSDRGGRDQWIAWLEEIMAEALRVVKPGAHALVWALPRTSHWTATALENAGWEVRDRISHIFGSGFPKSANVEKLLTKAQGQKRRAHGMVPLENPQSARMHSGIGSAVKPSNEDWWLVRKPFKGSIPSNILKYGEWLEDGTVYKVGTGGLNIDQSRVGAEQVTTHSRGSNEAFPKRPGEDTVAESGRVVPQNGIDPSPRTGRFPSNTLWSHVPGPNGCVRVGSRRVKGNNQKATDDTGQVTKIYGAGLSEQRSNGFADPDGLEEVPEFICADSCPVKALDEQSGVSKSPKPYKYNGKKSGGFTNGDIGQGIGHDKEFGDSGGPSRFFSQFHDPGFLYTPKASRAERNKGLEGMPEKHKNEIYGNGFNTATKLDPELHTAEGVESRPKYQNTHPCVKPLSLIRYLLKLVTPPGGTTLDPFAGSGTTGVAAIQEGFNAILIEQDESYVEIAERRCAHAPREHVEPQPKAPKQAEERMKKGEVRTAREWGLKNMHPQDMLLRYNPDERPEEGGTFEPVKEAWEDKRTGPEPDDLNFREVIEKYASALSKTEEQFKDKLF